MKITRILPRRLAISWQEYDLNKVTTLLEYHIAMVQVLEQLKEEGSQELGRLKENC